MDNVTNLLKICQDKPDLFNKLFLNRPPYWSRQIDLCRSVVEYYPGNKEGHIPTRSASEGPMKSSESRRGSPLDD